jgi:hypothetical protein
MPASAAIRFARAIPQPFECRPTAMGLPDDWLPDELMINWGALPAGAEARFFLPAVAAGDVIALANRLYYGRPYTKVDNHTVQTQATGLSYFPIPPGPLPGPNFAGLLTIRLPPGLALGQRIVILVRQLSNVKELLEKEEETEVIILPNRNVRQAVGAFQLNVTVQSAASLLVPTEQNFAFFQWVVSTMSLTNRWYSVLIRYLSEISNNIQTLGSNPLTIPPSPTGSIPGLPSGGQPPPPHHGSLVEHSGKVEILNYDRFGDFEGFVLITERGAHIHYRSRESHVAELMRFVWTARVRVTVYSSHHEPHVPVGTALHA